ncbi:hypothetical protein [Methylobacterium radiotolerans]|uniref:hypothetical protein n=1 Tax=Methylobacterium radiotolerans TaxID=31998 RepID=UPI000D5E0F46|nr:MULTISPECIES: hypothetical protein [Methylobacterium]MDE3749383.1 hypothetical protein [Methylobacterium radiotolerans]PVY97944.1 hypothetical protein C7388_112198 [Methylobacterium organophilum]
MKLPPILTGIVLDPAAGTLDFSALGAGFDPRTVLGVLHEPTNRFLFAKGRSGLGYASITGSVMTLAIDTSGLAAGPLTGFRDDGALIATDARLEACRALLATANATLSNLATGLGTPSDVAPGSDAAAGSLIAKVTRLLGTQSGIATVLAAVRDRLPAALVGGRLSVDGSGVVQPVTVGNFPATQAVSGTVSLGAGAAQIGTIGNAFALDATAQAGNTSAAAIASATGSSADVATASGANTTVVGALRAIRDRLLATLTVSGTVTANQGAGGASAWKVDGSATTQPVSAASLPLPAGAATAAKQPALGTAGAASADVLTVQGVANGTLLPVSAQLNGGTATVFMAAGSQVFGSLLANSTGGSGATYALYYAAGTAAAGQILKGSAGNVFVVTAWNSDTAPVWVKLFNKASAPTMGADAAVWEAMVPAGGQVVVPFADIGLSFGAGIAVGFSGAQGNTNATALNAAGKAGVSVALK